jgi:hypothetical protein
MYVNIVFRVIYVMLVSAFNQLFTLSRSYLLVMLFITFNVVSCTCGNPPSSGRKKKIAQRKFLIKLLLNFQKEDNYRRVINKHLLILLEESINLRKIKNHHYRM